MPDHIWLKQKAQKKLAVQKAQKKLAVKKTVGKTALKFKKSLTKKTVAKKTKGAGKGKKKQLKMKKLVWTPFSKLPEEKLLKIKAKHQERSEKEGREVVGDTLYHGTCLKLLGRIGWIIPKDPSSFPANVQTALATMAETHKAKAVEKGTEDKHTEGVVFMSRYDVNDDVKLEEGKEVKFKVYTDSTGVGACEVQAA